MRNYRALTKDTKRWAYGWYCEVQGRHFILLDDANIESTHRCYIEGGITGFVEVIPETVGQSTGLKDKHGKEGYAADAVRFFAKLYVISWNVCNACFYLKSVNEQEPDLAINNLLAGEIVGNVHQPELMEKQDGA